MKAVGTPLNELEPRQAGLLAGLMQDRVRISALERSIGYKVGEARNVGLSWEEIGAALGITRQAAHARFRDPAPVAPVVPVQKETLL